MKINEKTGKIKYDKIIEEDPSEEKSKEVNYSDLEDVPSSVERTSVSIDLSGAADTKVCLHTELKAEITRAFILYTEASSADAGVTLEVGKESDRDYYYTGTSEVSKAIWNSSRITLLKKDIEAGDTITLYSAGGKSGTGEVMLTIEYKVKGIYNG